LHCGEDDRVWLQQATIAERVLPDATGDDRDFHAGKLQACRFFFFILLRHRTAAGRIRRALVRDAERSAFDMRAEWF
jgi:hypothetical protein